MHDRVPESRQWVDKMKEIGLQPTDTGEEGGKETGDRVHHIIVPGGKFDRVVQSMTSRGVAKHGRKAGKCIDAERSAAGEQGRA